MIKKFMLLAAVVLPMFVSAQTLKVGLVDTQEIIGKMPETTEVQNKLNESQKKYQAELELISKEFQKLYEEIQNMKEDELPAIKERKLTQLQETQRKGEAFEQQVMQDLQKQQQELMAPVIQKVRGAIESVAKEGGYTYVQEKDMLLYFAAPVEDITDAVKRKLGI